MGGSDYIRETRIKVVNSTILNIILFMSVLFSQEKDSLIQLYSGLGDTVDQFVSSYFEIFQNIEGYQKIGEETY
jgi:hypothetical protein